MNKAKSIWSKADTFLSLTRKILLNSFTVVVLLLLTVSIFGILGSFFEAEDEIDVQDKILWFKSVAAFVRTSMRSSNSCCLISVEPKRRESREAEELEELSTTTPTGLNHKILS